DPPEKTLPKLGMQPIRRRQLILATIRCMSEYGFARTTIARIGKTAGVTPSIIHHYFGGKDDLLEPTVRFLLEQLRQNVVRQLTQATNARQRVEAIIAANFADDQFNDEPLAAWMALWAQAQHHHGLHRLQQIYARRLQSNLRHALRQLVDENAVQRGAFGLAALVDGLWLNCSLNGEANGALARAVALNYIDK